jgi:hypothetical protein
MWRVIVMIAGCYGELAECSLLWGIGGVFTFMVILFPIFRVAI